MDKQELKLLVAELLQQIQPQLSGAEATQKEHTVKDLSSVDLRMEYLVPNAAYADVFQRLKKKTPARLGLGRAGARYKTESMLRFRADHAAAQDSVFSSVKQEFLDQNKLTIVQTMCPDKETYLTRPDLGRRFDEENQTIIRSVCGEKPRILLLIGDGLSSDAVMANAMDCAKAIEAGLKLEGHVLPKPLFIRFARVGAMDHIGSITGAELICMLVGERPGLATSESMSAYITYAPRIGIAESKRTVVSNIHRNGTPAVEAGAYIAELLQTMLEKRASGIDLR